GWTITGHSLGGGLDSAAALTANFRAYTFNAAGPHQNTVINQSQVTQLITSYKVGWDILSWGQ
ncbi:MAG: hypothetical protein ACRC2T_16640, partial [Thermoguttaceae bacterium]